jgi:hypothetical protein
MQGWPGQVIIGRGVGNSSSDEDGSDAMKYWEVIADNLSKAGWSWGCVSAIDSSGANDLDCRSHFAAMGSVSLYARMKS